MKRPIVALALGAMLAFLIGTSMFVLRPAVANHGPYATGDVFASVEHLDTGTGIAHNIV